MKILKDIYYTEEKDGARSLDVYLPDGECKAVFLYIHGGGIERGDKGDQHREGEYLSARGYAFISINYRMYPDAKFPEFIEDSASAVAWAKKNGVDMVVENEPTAERQMIEAKECIDYLFTLD